MSDDGLKYQAENLEGLAQGILEGAQDVSTGKAALVDAYKKYNWDDPKKALEIVEYYGEAVRNKLQDQTPLPNVNSSLPVALEDVVGSLPKDANDKDLYNKWEELNVQALKDNTDPVYAVNKPLLLKQLKSEASTGRRQANEDSVTNSSLKEASDIGNRFLKGVSTGLGISAAGDALGYDLNNWITEYTDPSRDEHFFSKATEVIGNAAGGYLAFSKGGTPVGIGAGILQGSDAVVGTYNKTKENTGDPSKALEAGAIEAGAQAVQLFGEATVLGNAASKVAEPTIRTVFGGLKAVAKAAGIQGVVGGTSKVISNQAENIQEKGNPAAKTDALRGVGEAASLGAVVGGFIQGGAELTPQRVLGPGNDPSIRQREIDAEGSPLTTQVKQVIGDLFKPEDSPVNPSKDPVVSDITLVEPTTKDVTTPNQLPESILSSIHDAPSSTDGVVSLNYYTEAERDALRKAGLVKSFPSVEGGAFEGIYKEDIANLRDKFKEAQSKNTTDSKELYNAAKDVAEQAASPIEETVEVNPTFTMDRGTTYHDDGSGQLEGEHVILPSEKQIFLTDDEHQKLTEAVSQGSHVYLDAKGVPVVESKTFNDGAVETQITPIENATTTPTEGLHAWNLNSEKSPIKGQVLRQASPAGKVVTVHDIPLKSVGASQRTPDALTQFSQKVIASEGVVPEEAKSPVGYYKTSGQEVASDTAQAVQREGFDNIYNRFITKPETFDPVEQSGFIRHALENFQEGLKQATDEGDFEKYQQITQQLKEFLALPQTQGTTIAQGLQQRSNLPFAPLERVSSAFDKGVESFVSENLPEIQKVNEEVVTKAIELQKARSEIPQITPEELAVTEEVETQAQDSFRQDIETLDTQVSDLETQARQAQKSQERERVKEISKVEKQLSEDTLTLANAIEEAKQTKISNEEDVAKSTEEFETNRKMAEKEANDLISKKLQDHQAEIENTHKTALEEATAKVEKAANKLIEHTTNNKEKLIKLKVQARSDDPVIAEKATKRIQDIQERSVKLAQAVNEAKNQLQLTKEEISKFQDAEKDTIKELQSGIELAVVPKRGNTRHVEMRTKAKGLNVSKLLKGSSLDLAGLGKAISNIAQERSTGGKLKEVTSEKIQALRDKIAQSKKLVKDLQEAPRSKEQEISKLRKKIENLQRKKESLATPEDRAATNPTYKKIQTKRTRFDSEKARKLSEAEKVYNESLSKKKELAKAAKKAGLKKAADQQKVNFRIQELEQFKKDNKLTPSQIAVVDDTISLLDVNSKQGEARYSAYSYWIANQVGNGTNTLAALLTSGLYGIPLGGVPHVSSTVRALFNNLTKGDLSAYRYPLLSFFKGALASPTTWKMAFESGKNALLYGARFEGVAKREELIGKSRFAVNKQAESLAPIHTDFRGYLNKKTNGENFFSWATKHPVSAIGVVAGHGLAEVFTRALTTVEGVTKSLHYGGMDEAGRDFYYNETLRQGNKEALSQYTYDRKSLWKEAQAKAALNADGLRKLGIEVTPGEQHVQSLESYYENLPRQVMVDAQKRAQQMVFNGPAGGTAGAAGRFIEAGASMCNIPLGNGRTVNPIKYLTVFSNAGAHAVNFMLEFTPLSIASAFSPVGPKSPMERSMLLSSGMVSLGMLGGLAVKALANLDQDEKDRHFDIIGKYSSDPKKTAAFLNAGGSLYSVRVGNKYISFKDTQLGMGFGAVAAIVDLKRDGKLSDEDLNTRAGISTMLMLGGVSILTAPAQISFMKTLGTLYDSISKASQASEKGDVAQVEAVAGTIGRQILGIGKGFIPGAGVLRTISHYTDNPVEAQKDFQSAIVQNIPYFQSHGITGVVSPLPALNILGEVLDTKNNTGLPAIHRVFSTRKDDVDIRWLTDNGYTIPDPYQVLTKKNTTLKHLGVTEGLTTRQEHALAQVAAPANREIIQRFREALGSSAFNERTQKSLNKAIRRNYAMSAARLGLPAIESSETEGQVE